MKFYRFCARCGVEYSPEWQEKYKKNPVYVKCLECGLGVYNNPKSAAGAILINGDKYLMAVRGKEPMIGTLDVPGGFVDYGESAESAIQRELEEELGLVWGEYEILGMAPTMHNFYVYQGEEYSVMTVFYIIQTDRTEFNVSDDVAGYEWISLDNLPSKVAFPELREYLETHLAQIKTVVR